MGPTEALKTAVRRVLLADAALMGLVVASGDILPDDALPAAKVVIHAGVPTHVMGLVEAFREVRFSVEWLGEDAGGQSAVGSCDEPNERTRELLFEAQDASYGDGKTARERLNGHLEPLGWTCDHPFEAGYIPEHRKQIGRDQDDVRWAIGYFYWLNMEKI